MFVLAFDDTDNGDKKVEKISRRKYFLPRVNTTNYNVVIDVRNFYDQPVNDLIRQYGEIRKTAAGQGNYYTGGCLIDYQYFKDHENLIVIDLSRKRELDPDSRAIKQTEFYGMLNTIAQIFTILKSKERMLEFYKGAAKKL